MLVSLSILCVILCNATAILLLKSMSVVLEIKVGPVYSVTQNVSVINRCPVYTD